MKTYTNLVDVFLGTGGIELPEPQGVAATWHFIKGLAGNNNPGATLPFGKLSVCSYSGGYPSGYGHLKVNTGEPLRRLHEDGRMYGFSHIHHDGTGFINHFHNYAVTAPFYGALPNARMPVHMSDEAAEPGLYSLKIAETGVVCHMSVSGKAAVHRYAFGQAGGRIAIDFSNDGLYREAGAAIRNNPGGCIMNLAGPDAVTAEVTLAGLRLYFCARFRGRLKGIRLWSGDAELESAQFSAGETNIPFGCVADFADPGDAEMLLSISPLSMEKARADCFSETRTFEEIRDSARALWENALGAIEIETSCPKMERLFYSNLYHTLVKPTDWSGENFISPGEEDLVLDFATLWDQYKTQMPLLFTLYPDISKKILSTILTYTRAVGHLPHQLLLDGDWRSIEQMQARALAVYLVLDAHYRGIPGDYPSLLEQIARDLFENPHNNDFLDGRPLAYAAQEIDLAEACGLACDLARALGHRSAKERFAHYAGRWKDAFDADGLVRAESKFYEGCRWNYSFRLLREMEERIRLGGGPERFLAQLDRFFGFTHREDVRARFEGFNNETDMETPFAYHYVGRHDRIAEITNACMNHLFSEGRGGIPGNNDSGGLSSCWLWLAMGIFPVSGQNLMLVGAPQLDSVRMRLSNGKTFRIVRRGQGKVVRSATLNGRALEKLEFSAGEMMQGGELVVHEV